MSNIKRRFLLYFLIGFVLSLIGFFINNFGYRAEFYEEINNIQNGKSYSFNIKLRKSGCYWVGFSSPNISLMSYKLKGEYILKYYDNNNLLREFNATRTLGGAAYSRSDFTENIIDQIQVPLKGHKKMRVELTVIKSDEILTDENNQIYFFLRRDILNPIKCRKIDFEKIKRDELIKENPINTAETNTTLIPLYNALKEKNLIKVKDEIKKYGVDVKMLNNRTPLHYAAFFNDDKTTKYLIELGADIHIKDIANMESIKYAIENNATKTTKILLDSGVNINEVGDVDPYLKRSTRMGFRKLPPIFYSSCNGLFEMTKLLLEYGVNTDKILGGRNVYAYAKYSIDTNKVPKEIQEKILKLLDSYSIKLIVPRRIIFDKEIR